MDDNQIRPTRTAGEWADEYQHQQDGGFSPCDDQILHQDVSYTSFLFNLCIDHMFVCIVLDQNNYSNKDLFCCLYFTVLARMITKVNSVLIFFVNS